MAESIDSWGLKVVFNPKMKICGIPFCIDFLDFVLKWRKCEISEEYNAKRGSEPSKRIDFRIDFSYLFHVFVQTSFQRLFLESPSAELSSKVRFWSRFGFRWDHKSGPLVRHFRPKRLQRSSRPDDRKRTRADPCNAQRCTCNVAPCTSPFRNRINRSIHLNNSTNRSKSIVNNRKMTALNNWFSNKLFE